MLSRCARTSDARVFELRGFTLIEVVVVMVVIAVLASLVAPNVFKHVGEAKNVTAHSQIEMLGAALRTNRLKLGVSPFDEPEAGLSPTRQRR